MEYILTTEGLTKAYGKAVVADNINLHIKKGEVYGLIGRNGAGKTTILKMIAGLSTPTSGSFTFMGKKNDELVKDRSKIGSLIETPSLFPKMSAFQNVKLKCLAFGINDDKYVKSLLERVGLSNVGKKNAQSFSLGMRQRLGIALALVGNPELIILDEPINGLDPQGIAEMRVIMGDRGRWCVLKNGRAPTMLMHCVGDALPVATSRNEPLVSELPDGFRWTCELYSKTRAFLNELRIDGAA